MKKLLVVVETDDSVGHRRILITLVVAQAWLWLHTEKKDSITNSFKQTADGTEDAKLYVRGLLDITVRP